MVKDQILEMATELFMEQGFKSVTMDDLAQKMGISKKTIYAHFENKTQLVEESTMTMFWKISDGIDHICSIAKNPIKELYEIKKFVMRQLRGDKSIALYQLQKYYPEIHKNMRAKQFEVMLECVVRNIEAGMQMGIYRENLDVGFVSRIYFVGATAIKDYKLFPSGLFSLESLMDHYLEYHLRGIITPEGRKVLNGIINSNQE